MSRRPPRIAPQSPRKAAVSERPWVPWYGTQAWKRRARRQLEDEPLCRLCRAQGRIEVARVADHVVDHKGDRRAFWEGGLQSLCLYHHNSKTRLSEAERKTGKVWLQRGCTPDGMPLDRRHSWWQER